MKRVWVCHKSKLSIHPTRLCHKRAGDILKMGIITLEDDLQPLIAWTQWRKDWAIISSELPKNRWVWSVSIRDVVSSIGDVGSTRPEWMPIQVQVSNYSNKLAIPKRYNHYLRLTKRLTKGLRLNAQARKKGAKNRFDIITQGSKRKVRLASSQEGKGQRDPLLRISSWNKHCQADELRINRQPEKS